MVQCRSFTRFAARQGRLACDVGVNVMKELSIAPKRYVTGRGALRDLGSVAARYGRRVLIIHGEHGYARVETSAETSLEDAGLEAVATRHTGPCTDAAIEAHSRTAHTHVIDMVIAIGGGRVLDVAKGTAHAAGLPCVTVPTSPATCSGTTAVVVDYDDTGAYLGSRLLDPPPIAAVVDTDVLVQAPNRLLAAGIADALAKVYEVRFASKRAGTHSATALAASKLCDELEALIAAHAKTALNMEGAADRERDRALVAEAVVLWPGLIGGLVGETGKLAAAHAVHNALTHLPGSKVSLHGELVAFGILVQQVLEGASPKSVRDTADTFMELGCPCSLEALGCGAFHGGKGSAIASRAAELSSMRIAFPEASANDIYQAMLAADLVASAAMAIK